MTDALTASPVVRTLGVTLLHFVWQGAVIGLATAFVLTILRRAAATTRYAVACAGLALMLALPVMTWMWPSRTAAPASSGPAATVTGSLITASLPVAKGAATVPWSSRDMGSAAPLVVGIWMAGVLLLTLRLVRVSLAVGRLRRRTSLALPEVWQSRIGVLATRIGIRRPLRTAESSMVDVPTVIGWLRPLILVPTSALAGLAPAELEAILAHELAHVRRHDHLVNLIQRVAETLLFYHPAVWWVSRQITLERELCCDDVAVATCGDRVVYARALTSLEELRPATAALTLAATDGPLLLRIRRLLGATPSEADRSPIWTVMAVVLTLSVLFAMTSRGIDAQTPASNTQAHEDIRLMAALVAAPFRDEPSHAVYLNAPQSSATPAQQPRAQVPPPPPPPPTGQRQIPPPAPPPATPESAEASGQAELVTDFVDGRTGRWVLGGRIPVDPLDAEIQRRVAAFGQEALQPNAGIQPIPIAHRSPLYTPDAMRNKVQGFVLVEAVVQRDGSVGDVRIMKSLDPVFGLDEEALKAAKLWRFEPPLDRSGQPVAVVVRLLFDLRLH